MKQYIGISRDHSISMQGIARAAARDYNDNIAVIREAAHESKVDTIVSVVKSGVGAQGKVVREVVNSAVGVLHPIQESAYVADGHSTPLLDSIGDLISMLESVPDASDPNVSFLVMAITDGEENSSRLWNWRTLAEKMRRLTATDRWSFIFRVPRGYARELIKHGIQEGNILEWDQTSKGVEVATQATRQAFTNFYQARSSGVSSTTKFYANLAQVDPKAIKKALVDISSEITIWPIMSTDPLVINAFVEKRMGSLPRGAAFYQLSKTEEVQDHKQIVVREKSTGRVYGGQAARDLLGLPTYGTVKLVPGNNGGFDVFVQSTSVNRKLIVGTNLLYWPNAKK